MSTVTAAISVYNGEKYIIRCLTSVVSQTRQFDEIIVYNDASTDATEEIVTQYINEHPDANIRLINSDINRGPGGGKNYAKDQVTTDFFSFVDADDYVGKEYLAHLLEAADKKEEPRVDIVFGGFCKVNAKGEITYKRIFEEKEDALIGGFQNWGNLYSKRFFEYNEIEIPGGKVLEDVLTRAVMIGYNPVCQITKGYCDYHYVENSESVSKTYMNKFIPGVICLEMDYLSRNKEKVREDRRDLYEYYAYKVFVWHMLKSGAGVGWKSMKTELKEGYHLFGCIFPDYKRNRYIKNRAPRGERTVVRMALRLMYITERLKLNRFVMFLYSSIDVSFLWPKM